MLLARLRRLTIPVILTGLMACDNVSWGGVELRLEPPPPTEPVAEEAGSEPEPELQPLDVPPALFIVERSEAGARLFPVALLGPEGPRALPTSEEIPEFAERFREERMASGRQFTLFSRGARVGTFHPEVRPGGEGEPAATPQEGESPAPLCRERPTVNGWIEILPAAMDRERFLAVPSGAVEPPNRAFVPRATTPDQRTGALNMASALYVLREIRWPPSVLEARADMEVIQLPGAEEEAIVATFLYGDEIALGPAPPNAYSLFFIGLPGGRTGYEPNYVRYREVGPDGKSVPVFVDHADWDGDGRQDALLELYEETGRAFATISRTGDGWVDTFEEECTA